MKQPAIAIFDIGKTNKKLLIFDESYQVLREESVQFKESEDEDGFPCENLALLSQWIKDQLDDCINDSRFDMRAVNVAAYGASFVNLDGDNKPVTAIYNYLKPFPQSVQEQFFERYGGRKRICLETCSPSLGSLNSGLQLYRLKCEQPGAFARVAYALHLPQYISFLMTGACYSDWSSIGCHTMLWDFSQRGYHHWVTAEQVQEKLPGIVSSRSVKSMARHSLKAGIGIHDSSAALIPYLTFIQNEFVLVSTGTWSISLNPFNDLPLTDAELENDCLCYLTVDGLPVKASRLFTGYEHDESVRRLADHFHCDPAKFRSISFNANIWANVTAVRRDLKGELPVTMFTCFEEGYHALMYEVVQNQVMSLQRILTPGIKNVFVDGGFAKNDVYMTILASMLPSYGVFAASLPQATAVGAAMAIHEHWNMFPVPEKMLQFSKYIARTYPRLNSSPT